jgi:hypothetical protein
MDGGSIALRLVQIISGEQLPGDVDAAATGLGIVTILLVSIYLLISDVRFLWARFRKQPTSSVNVIRSRLRERWNLTEAASRSVVLNPQPADLAALGDAELVRKHQSLGRLRGVRDYGPDH